MSALAGRQTEGPHELLKTLMEEAEDWFIISPRIKTIKICFWSLKIQKQLEERLSELNPDSKTQDDNVALWEEFFITCHQHGVITSLDPNVRPLLVEDRVNYINRLERMFRFADIIKLSDEDLAWLYPDMEMSAAFDHLISISSIGLRVLTKGADGARACSGAAEIEAPAHPVRSLVDTVGAGDTFMASMLAWLVDHDISDAHAIHDLSSEELEAMVERAAKAAALNCEKHGCNPPTREDLLS